MLDTYVLFKNLVAVGIPEAQAKVIQNAAFNYLEAITTLQDKEYEKLFEALLKSGLNKHQAELVAGIIKVK